MSTRDEASMNDGERDAWLREALRHAPDADATPPRDVSDTILARARAAARVGAAPGRAVRTRNPIVALWDWLARPPVAAGFASILAATLVGLMWWDRPMDETLPRRSDSTAWRERPAPSSDVGAAAPSAKQVNPNLADHRAVGGEARAPFETAPAPQSPAPSVGTATQPPQPARQQHEDRMLRSDKAPANAKVLTPPAAAPPPLTSTAPLDTKEQQRKLESANGATFADPAPAKPSPFARGDDERAAAPAKKLDADAKDAKAVDRAAPADALASRDAALAKSKAAAAPSPPAEASRSEPPSAFGREPANALARTSPSVVAEGEATKRAPPAGATASSTPVPAAAATMQAAAPAAAPPALRDGASTADEKQASAFPPSQSGQVQSELAAARRDVAGATPLAPIVAAITNDAGRWSRSTAGGVVALEAGWRDWLMQLDAAARGRWQSVGAANERERDGTTTLRLVDAGRSSAVVRLEGTTVRVDAIDGERWQATLPPAAAERLRATAERLAR